MQEFYALRGQIVEAERRLAALDERLEMRAMRDEIKDVENLRKAADRLAREGQNQQTENER